MEAETKSSDTSLNLYSRVWTAADAYFMHISKKIPQFTGNHIEYFHQERSVCNDGPVPKEVRIINSVFSNT